MDPFNSTQPTEVPKRTSKDVWNDIEDFLATTDGISTRDAFRLGSLVREYGNTTSGEALGPMMAAIVTSITKQKDAPKKPWEE